MMYVMIMLYFYNSCHSPSDTYISAVLFVYCCKKEQNLMIFMSEFSVCPRKEEKRKEAMVQVIISCCLTGVVGGGAGSYEW